MKGIIKKIEHGADRNDNLTYIYITTECGPCYHYFGHLHDNFAEGDKIEFSVYESLAFRGIDKITKGE